MAVSFMKKAYGLGLLTVLFWSTSATAFKITLGYMDVLQLLFYSIVTAVVILGGFLGVTGKFSELFRLGKKEYLICLALGILNPFIYYWMAVTAYDLLPAQVAQPVNYTWVITLTLLSVPLLKQPLGKEQILATLVCYLGVVVISWRGNIGQAGSDISYLGLFLAVSCTIIWALYWIYNIRRARDPILGIFLNFLFSLPFAGLACWMFSSFSFEGIEGLLGAVWIGCFEFGFAFIAWITALRLGRNTGRITNLVFLTPFLSLVCIHYILGEKILVQTWIGLFLIIIGIGIQKMSEARQE